jgi:4-amino-4-deoxy-L-arabinose transferase-like glycosyltransferase
LRKLTLEKKIAIILITIFSIIGAWLVRNSVGTPVTRWGQIYSFEDLTTYQEILNFFKNLRIPVPPLISVIEILNYNLIGDTHFVTKFLYRLSLVSVYLLTILLVYPSIPKMIASFLVSIVFLWSTVIIHPGNPQVYDIFYPLLVLLIVFLLRGAAWIFSRWRKLTGAICLLLGVVLAIAELTRPFVLFLLPILVLAAYQMLRRLPRRYFVILLMPVLIISGTWHAYIGVQHGQVTWTNHSGYNLQRGWRIAPVPELLQDPDDNPLKPGRKQNKNTAVHYENSKILQRAIFKFWIENPFRSAKHALYKTFYFLSGQTKIYSHSPEHLILSLYKPLTVFTSTFLFIGVLVLMLLAVESGRFRYLVERGDHILMLVAVGSILILALGEADEEARLLLSVLPFLAVLPIAMSPDLRSWQRSPSKLVPAILCTGGILAIILVVLVDFIRGEALDFGLRQFALTSAGIVSIGYGFDLHRKRRASPLEERVGDKGQVG